MTASPRRSLASRLTLVIGLYSTALGLAVLGLAAGLIFLHLSEDLDLQARTSALHLARSLELPIWNRDMDAAQDLCQALAHQDDVEFVEVTGPKNEIISQHQSDRPWIIEASAKINHYGQFLGRVRLGLNDDRRRQSLLLFLPLGAGLVVFIALCHLLLHRSLIRPLLHEPFADLGRIIDAYAAGDFSSPRSRPPAAEFASLYARLESMGRTMQGKMETLKENQSRLAMAFDAANDGLWDWDVASGRTYFSPRYYAMLGYEPEDFEPTFESWLGLVHPDDLQRTQDTLRARMQSGEPYSAEFRMRHKSGEWHWILGRGRVVKRDGAGAPLRMSGTHVNITAVKTAQQALEASESRFAKAFDASPAPQVLSEIATGRIFAVNDSWVGLLEHSREEQLGRTSKELGIWVDPSDRDRAVDILAAKGALKDYPIEFVTKSGRRRHTLWSAEIISLDGKDVLLSFIYDYTERKRAEEALARSEEQYRSLFEVAQDAIFVHHHGRFVDCNGSAEALLGRTREEILGKRPSDFSPRFQPDGRESDKAEEQIMKDSLAGKPLLFDWTFQLPDEALILAEVSLQSLGSGNGDTLMAMIRDVTERRRAEQLLRQSEEKFSRLFMLSPDIILLTDMETGRIMDVNESFLLRTGYSRDEVLGRTAVELGLFSHPPQHEELRERLRQAGKVENFEFACLGRHGQDGVCSLSAQVLDIEGRSLVLSISRDVTEVKRMQEIMVQTEKMISVGGIAAGIAHEINNPLGIVLQATQNLVQRTRTDFPKNREAAREAGLDMDRLADYMRARKLDKFIEDIRAAALRASSIIRHLLDFSRRSESRRALCDLAAIADRALTLARNDYDLKKNFDFKRIKVNVFADQDLEPVTCTETEIEQVLLNLLRNAAQAMAEAGPPVAEPRIDVRLLRRKNGVRIEVQDNGPGIPEDIRNRIFEPFFTTKGPDVGTGLGLSVSYFIVTKGHDGEMSVQSAPGEGARFVIDLPDGESSA
ncbi:PAS domain-containing sensor histidine kinase [Desulfocurvus sp. DL9XJH121]